MDHLDGQFQKFITFNALDLFSFRQKACSTLYVIALQSHPLIRLSVQLLQIGGLIFQTVKRWTILSSAKCQIFKAAEF